MKPIDISSLDVYPAYINNKPYVKGLKTTSRECGLYFIYENMNLVYIGMTRFNLKKVIYRHFQKWGPDKRKPYKYNVSYNKESSFYHVSYIKMDDIEDNIHKNEILNILHYKPRDNANKYPQYEQAFLNDLQQVGVHVSNDKNLPF